MPTVHLFLLEAKITTVAARCEEDGSEARSVVNHVVRIFNFSFILKCMFLFARFFPFQFLTRTNETELS